MIFPAPDQAGALAVGQDIRLAGFGQAQVLGQPARSAGPPGRRRRGVRGLPAGEGGSRCGAGGERSRVDDPAAGRLDRRYGAGSVRIGNAPFSGPVPRDDVAGVLARLLADSRSVGRVLYLSSGAQSIEQALDEVLGSPGSAVR